MQSISKPNSVKNSIQTLPGKNPFSYWTERRSIAKWWQTPKAFNIKIAKYSKLSSWTTEFWLPTCRYSCPQKKDPRYSFIILIHICPLEISKLIRIRIFPHACEIWEWSYLELLGHRKNSGWTFFEPENFDLLQTATRHSLPAEIQNWIWLRFSALFERNRNQRGTNNLECFDTHIRRQLKEQLISEIWLTAKSALPEWNTKPSWMSTNMELKQLQQLMLRWWVCRNIRQKKCEFFWLLTNHAFIQSSDLSLSRIQWNR